MPADSKSPKIFDLTMACASVTQLLLNLSPPKARTDELKHRLLKDFTNETFPILTIIFQKSLLQLYPIFGKQHMLHQYIQKTLNSILKITDHCSAFGSN